MSNFHVKVKAEVTEEFLSSIMITAFDGTYGGSWSWAAPNPGAEAGSWLTVKEEGALGSDQPWLAVSILDNVELEDWMATREPDDPDKVKVYNVTHAVLAKGLQGVIDAGSDNIQQAIFDDDAGMIDANGADWIVQMGLFGKLVYS